MTCAAMTEDEEDHCGIVGGEAPRPEASHLTKASRHFSQLQLGLAGRRAYEYREFINYYSSLSPAGQQGRPLACQ